MSTVHIERNRLGQAIRAIDMVDSPDDNGWYFHEYDFVKRRDRTSIKIFPSAEAARNAFAKKAVKWEAWR
jgi:hypothetical protein